MDIATNLRRLRLQRGMTQSVLADHLGVSDRAVSRWETGQALPDVSLLPRLAMLLQSSVDALLGVDETQRHTAIQDALARTNAAMQQGKTEEAVSVLRSALGSWPDEPELQVALARTLMALHTTDGAREALALCRAADGKPARLSTLYGCKQVMALALHRLGKSDQAAQLVSDEIPSFWICRELLYPRVAPPDKADGQRQFNLLWLADQTYFTLREMAVVRPAAEAIALLERAIRIYREAAGDNAGLYEERICQAYLRMAELLVGLGDADGALQAWQAAKSAALRYAAHTGRYAVPWLAHIQDEATPPDAAAELMAHVRSRHP